MIRKNNEEAIEYMQMNRSIKQLIYGTLYLVILGALGWGIYGIAKPTASCFDNKLNQDEQEVDCGGKSCIVCAIRHLKPLQAAPLNLFRVGDQLTALLEFRNPNSTYGASSFSYTITLYDSQGTVLGTQQKTSFIYPTEIKNVFATDFGVSAASVARGESVIDASSIAWRPLNDFPLPRAIVRSTTVETDSVKHEAVVRGILVNDNSFVMSRATIVAIASDAFHFFVGTSQTLLQAITPQEERPFRIVIPGIQEPLRTEQVKLYVEVVR